MTATTLAQRAYGQGSTPIRTPRGAEYDAFARITHQLISAARRGKADFPALAKAIQDNRRLWTTLATDVAGEGNLLPQDLRARIFYLAEFTQSHSGKVLRHGASVAPLVEINAAIMRGLRNMAPES